MIKVTYEVTERRTIFLSENVNRNWRMQAREAVDKIAHSAKIVSIEGVQCERCGCDLSLVQDKFICVECNSR